MAEQIRAQWGWSHDHKLDGMSNRFQHRSKQDGHVVAIAGAQLQNPSRGVQDLQPEWIFCVPYVPLHPFEEGLNFAQIILGGYPSLKENIDCLLPDVKILYTLANERLHVLEGFARAQISFRNVLERNLRLIGAG
jgi:hypothetical protein